MERPKLMSYGAGVFGHGFLDMPAKAEHDYYRDSHKGHGEGKHFNGSTKGAKPDARKAKRNAQRKARRANRG